MRYALAALIGLVAGAYTCLGVIILVAPGMGSEDALWYIYPSAVLGATLGVLFVRRLMRRRAR